LLRTRLSLSPKQASLVTFSISLFGILAIASLARTPDWLSYVIISRFTLDANHPLIAFLAFAVASGMLLVPVQADGNRFNAIQRGCKVFAWAGLACASLSGIFMFLKLDWLQTITRFSYSGLEFGLVIALSAGVMALVLEVIHSLALSRETLNE
jgi:hypothetical protein